MIDHHFGHGSAETIVEKRQSMMFVVHSHVGWNRVTRWFPDLHERNFFTHCMKLIADHHKEEEEEENCGIFDGSLSFNNPALWSRIKDKWYRSPDEDAGGKPGTYTQGKTTKAVEKSVAKVRKCPPVITYQSLVAVLKRSFDDLSYYFRFM